MRRLATARPARRAGKGAFGVVRLVLEKRTGQLYACKSISKAKLISKEDVEDVIREVRRRAEGPPAARLGQLRLFMGSWQGKP